MQLGWHGHNNCRLKSCRHGQVLFYHKEGFRNGWKNLTDLYIIEGKSGKKVGAIDTHTESHQNQKKKKPDTRSALITCWKRLEYIEDWPVAWRRYGARMGGSVAWIVTIVWSWTGHGMWWYYSKFIDWLDNLFFWLQLSQASMCQCCVNASMFKALNLSSTKHSTHSTSQALLGINTHQPFIYWSLHPQHLITSLGLGTGYLRFVLNFILLAWFRHCLCNALLPPRSKDITCVTPCPLLTP